MGLLQLEAVESDVAPIPRPLLVRFESNSSGDVIAVAFDQVQADKPDPTAADRCAEWILETLKTDGKQSAKTMTDWASGVGYSKGTLFRAAQQLEDSGALARIGRGNDTVWTLVNIEHLIFLTLKPQYRRTNNTDELGILREPRNCLD